MDEKNIFKIPGISDEEVKKAQEEVEKINKEEEEKRLKANGTGREIKDLNNIEIWKRG